jgi:hypothetical protein
LVETDEEGPDASAPEPPPRPIKPPEHRRVAVSLGFTIAVLLGTVVTIYTVFPPARDHLVRASIEQHRRADQHWQLERPDADELRAWAVAVLDDPSPLPAIGPQVTVIGARTFDVLHRRTALVRYQVGGAEISVAVQRARDLRGRKGQASGDQLVDAWRVGPYSCVAIGPAASVESWRAALGVP